MDEACINCRFYQPWKRAHYPRGKCLIQYAFRKSDKYKIYLDIITPNEFVCKSYEEIKMEELPVYVLTNNGATLLPPVIVNELLKAGWQLVQLKADNKIMIKKED